MSPGRSLPPRWPTRGLVLLSLGLVLGVLWGLSSRIASSRPGGPLPVSLPVSPGCEGLEVDPRPQRHPASSWRPCGDGCQELSPAPGSGHRYFALFGAARDGTRLLGYSRMRDASLELRVENLSRGQVLFLARVLEGAKGCDLRLRELRTEGALFEGNAVDGRTHPRSLFGVSFEDAGASPQVWPRPEGASPLDAVLGPGWMASTTTRRRVWSARWEDDRAPVEAWSAPDRSVAAHLTVGGDALLFSALDEGRASLWSWREGEPARPLVVPSAGGGAACPRTDGEHLVWFEGHGYDAERHAFTRMDLMTSPLAHHAEDLRPRRLRASRQDFLTEVSAVVGGGHALHLETRRGESRGTLVLTRLSDGATWHLPPRPGFHWGSPLYVDAEELAVVEDAPEQAFTAGELGPGESWTVVRRTLSSLGPPDVEPVTPSGTDASCSAVSQ
ncbi:hypothetical protein SAMN05443572_10388 [Myxococcus fulvus]|uniref:Lipoprotein n=1 Tax=Myxococcus fulvus TaxID=33 RepID=A0ABY1C6X6_MYXFU|nr:hypothetical protein [Myxococcus fulvus]SET75704.1 hypothetical protein SAMN05443572_10388 [Myxococcus fulvus]